MCDWTKQLHSRLSEYRCEQEFIQFAEFVWGNAAEWVANREDCWINIYAIAILMF